MQKALRVVGLFMLVALVAFAAGVYVGTRRADGLEAGLASLEALNRQLQSENSRNLEAISRLTGELDAINGRIDTAQDILAGISGSLENDGSTVDRALERVDRIESALEVIFGGN